LYVVLAAQLMAVINLTVFNIAAPTVLTDLNATGAGIQLVIYGYDITYAMSLITGARLGDRLGHGRAFRAGLILFTVASLACGLAGTTSELVIFRLIQGLGAGVMMPQVMSLIQRTYQGPARARALGMYSAVIALGAVIGQVAGGGLISADLFGQGWRPIFIVNVPIGIALLFLAFRWLPAGRGERDRHLDPAGVLVLSAAVLAIVLPLVLGHEENWPVWIWLSLAAGVLLVGAFVQIERRVAVAGGSPLISAAVIKAPGLAAGGITALLAMLSFSGFLFTLTLHLQGTLQVSAIEAGLLFAPAALGSAITSLNWQRLPGRMHRFVVPVGMIGSAVTYVLLAPIEGGGHLNMGWLIADMFAFGLLFGLAYGPIITFALAQVPLSLAADASGALITLLQLGQVLGVATLGTLYLTLLGHVPASHAAAITFAAVAGCSLLAAVSGTVLVRRRI
ncbi:MAG: major facilitator superfamily 1, partial [Pseudonocardiales bacterium]|nr:major facilitator superfamily 1 [Pseudonocardiales bacterium]